MTKGYVKSILKRFFQIVLLISVIEILLRYCLGFGNVPLYADDADYENIFKPDQNIYRLGKHFYTNHFSMRSDALTTNDSIRILFFGDSILNGGAATDNDDLATSILEKNLSAEMKRKVRALNISSSGWAPDNAAAYLQKHGSFGAKMIVLVFSSHDYFDEMGFERLVGKNSEYPDKNPCCAISDFVFNYLVPVTKHLISPSDISKKNELYYQHSKHKNTGWDFFIAYANQNNIPLLVYLHADRRESLTANYNQFGKRLIDDLKNADVHYILDIDSVQVAKRYRDFIHFNETGQQYMSDLLEPTILKALAEKP